MNTQRLFKSCRILTSSLLIILATLGLLLVLVTWGPRHWRIGGAFTHEPEELASGLTPPARALVERAFIGLGSAPLVDYHAHLLGLGNGSTGVTINPERRSWWHPWKHLQALVFISSAGVADLNQFDERYVERLVRLARCFTHPLRIHLLALDHSYNSDGTINPAETDFYIPNDYVVRMAAKYPDVFTPVISVHPARRDALTELERWAQLGVRYVKWLPNAQGIDPQDPHHDAFYRKLVMLHMVLLSHGGQEQAVSSARKQALGNPLRLRRALDLGTTIIMAHAACLGSSDDLDHPGQLAENFTLTLRLMNDERYRSRLFADISAMPLANRPHQPLLELIHQNRLHERLVNGSDYPLPAMNVAIWTSQLARQGLISAEERTELNAIYDYNPLLFDFVLKRTIKDPQTGAQLPASVFLANPQLVKLTGSE